jgi:DNA-binding transcriptional MerR regulator/methylmalonyl-CoA mutase cobalamin-binding subunit
MAERRALPHDAYPLRTVSQLTGLSPDLIRAWEKRYGVVSPIRGARGARLYSADDISHLRLLARAVEGGRAIGDVARYSREELQSLVASDEGGSGGVSDARPERALPSAAVERALAAVDRFDDERLSAALGEALAAHGAARFVERVAGPLLVEVGERWSRGSLSIAQEHLCSAALRSILHMLLWTRSPAGRASIVMATPSGERHEGGILMASLLVVDAGFHVCYLGPDVPADDILAAARHAAAIAVGLGSTGAADHRSVVNEVGAVERGLPPDVELWLGGSAAPSLAAELPPERLHLLADSRRLRVHLESLGRTIAIAG